MRKGLARDLGIFAVGFLAAFGLVFYFGWSQALPVLPLGLWIAVTLLLSLIPAAAKTRVRAPLICTYGFPFVLLWLLSEQDSAKPPVLLWLMTALSLFAFAWLASVWSSQRPMRLVISSAVTLFALTWLMAYYSSATGSGNLMVDWLRAHTHLTESSIATTVFLLRKTIHFLFYGSMAVLALRFARRGASNSDAQIAFPLLFVLAHASFDELRQSALASRTGSFYDVLLDLAGAAILLAVSRRFISARSLERKEDSVPTDSSP